MYFEYEEKLMSKSTLDKSLLDIISDPDGESYPYLFAIRAITLKCYNNIINILFKAFYFYGITLGSPAHSKILLV